MRLSTVERRTHIKLFENNVRMSEKLQGFVLLLPAVGGQDAVDVLLDGIVFPHTFFQASVLSVQPILFFGQSGIFLAQLGKVILKTPKPERSGVSLLIDIENCIKAQQSAGYERWAKIENQKRAARTMVFLDQHGFSRYTDLEQKITELQDSNEQAAAALKTAERRLSDLALLIKHTATYKELKPLYSEYKKPHSC